MTFIPVDNSPDCTAKVIYESKDGKTSKTFDALDWLAQLVTHIPNRAQQMVRYYGFYSNSFHKYGNIFKGTGFRLSLE